jgi:hypothetical protein
LLVHLDLDVLDYLDMPLAEEYRRNRGLRFDQLMASLRIFLAFSKIDSDSSLSFVCHERVGKDIELSPHTGKCDQVQVTWSVRGQI